MWQSKDDGASSINLCKLVYNNLLFVQGEISVWHELCQTNLQSGSNKVRPCLNVDKAPWLINYLNRYFSNVYSGIVI